MTSLLKISLIFQIVSTLVLPSFWQNHWCNTAAQTMRLFCSKWKCCNASTTLACWLATYHWPSLSVGNNSHMHINVPYTSLPDGTSHNSFAAAGTTKWYLLARLYMCHPQPYAHHHHLVQCRHLTWRFSPCLRSGLCWECPIIMCNSSFTLVSTGLCGLTLLATELLRCVTETPAPTCRLLSITTTCFGSWPLIQHICG